ncbi:hypothetical protein GLOIN_2v1875646 [Rhizophagus irregularis DAOM 181602=DAOM 197198]|uniref:F-box domain-containing protein n=1 Tax=Rhizophagus irregularis (strain DAOM 197198w) TaxID=1432141 RepID=A0A015J1T9_RHIIW|nr:hypothetical protein RirG_177780 [Rhizophagus irregularis DAOM 197198w]GBC49710.2 hypothetical protein GLOIN_2v1875646 [Rhizophagus irregularis DAOM 181602=DAOM 197198]
MACSKIFSGDLPELTNEIIQHFRKDFSTLYSCLLVNRFWCRLAIPLLWENPFFNPNRNYRYVEIYLSYLSESSKEKFNEHGIIINNLLPSNTLFNYPSFIKFLNISSIYFSIKEWVDILVDNNHEDLEKLVYRSLFEVFIENGGILHSFEIAMFSDIGNFNDTMELILQNPGNSNCPNTLNTIIFDNIDFKNIIITLQEVFDQLNVIESIHIVNCNSLNSEFVQQIIKVTKPFKLRTLFMKEILHIESLQFLLQKCGDYLENFEFGYTSEEYEESRRQLLKLVIKYCTKIKRLISPKPDDNNIYLLIKNIGKTINYLTINNYHDEYSSIVLQNLGQVLPSKLDYLRLSLSFNSSDLEIFLRNSQHTFIKKLLISNMMQNEGEGILFYIKEYIMRKERVKYLAFSEYYPNDDTDRELFSLEDEVNEFKLHNIIVQKCSDLYTSMYSFIYDFYI